MNTSAPETISATDALKILMSSPERARGVDVRSEGEFLQGALPYFRNQPILRDEERHQVGLTYKNDGQENAIKLGYELVQPHRATLVDSWSDTLSSAEYALVTCWRGGLRSKIATEWMREAGLRVRRVEGGYKSIRHELLVGLREFPELLVVAGPTGTAKTKLLVEAGVPAVDLEGIAIHKGSAFGRNLLVEQPSQATFENQLAFQFLRDKNKVLLIEDESLVIGKVHIPMSLKEKMRASPAVKIRMTIEDRVSHIYDDYITQPALAGIPNSVVEAYYQESLGRIKTKLGGLKEAELRASVKNAFLTDDPEAHRYWIQELLVHYYDKTYEYAFNKTPRHIAFEGDWKSCLAWIRNRYALLKP